MSTLSFHVKSFSVSITKGVVTKSMGVGVSKNEVSTEVANIFKSSLYNECPTVHIKQIQEVGDITVEEGCDLSLLLKQEAFYDDKCTLDTLVDSLTDYTLDNQQKISQGFLPVLVNVSNTSSREEVRNEVDREVKNICSKTNSEQKQIIGDIFCRSGKLNLPVLQKFQGRSACVANEVLRRADAFQLEHEQDVEQSSGIGAFFSKWLNLWGVIAIGAVIFFLLFLYFWFSNPEARKDTIAIVGSVANPAAGALAAAR